MAEYQCNSTNEIIISEFCTNGSDTSSVECTLAYDNITLDFRYIAGGWMIFIAILRIVGNLTTLLSIPWASKRKLYGFDDNFRSTTIYILHLSFIELCMSFFGLVPYSYQLLARDWPFGILLCRSFAIFAQIIGPTEASALACISITRCSGLKNGTSWKSFSNKPYNTIMLLSIPWILSIPTMLPYLVKSSGVEVGWSCTFGMCNTISTCQRSTSDNTCIVESNLLSNFIPFYMLAIVLSSIIIIITCYILINQKARRSSVGLKKGGHTAKQIKRRDTKMLRTILLLILCHGICNLPMRIALICDFVIQDSKLNLATWYVLVMIYQSQYAINFFIYAGSNEQYRKKFMAYWL